MEQHFEVMRGSMDPDEFYSEGGEYARFQRWYGHWAPRLAPHGDPELYDVMVRSYMDAKFHNTSSFKSNQDPWHEIGPKRITDNMFGIGPIRHIAISSTDPDHMLCTINSGGLFYTTDASGSCTWQNGGTDIGLPFSGCNWADYYPGTTDHWYTISAYAHQGAFDRIAYIGGLYRTGNSGADWVRIAGHAELGGPGTRVFQFVFDRKENLFGDHRMLLATSNGLYISDDPASDTEPPSWNLVPISAPQSVLDAYPSGTVEGAVMVFDLEYLPVSNDPTDVIGATMKFNLRVGSNLISVWRFMISTDNGETWAEIPDQAAISSNLKSATIETSAAAPGVFFCHGVGYYSDSWVNNYDLGTQSWTGMANNIYSNFGQGHAFGVDQFDATSFMVGRSVDLNWYRQGSLQTYPYPGGGPQFVNSSTGHDDVEDIVAHPQQPGIFWVANHGGVSRVNTNVNPRVWEFKCEGLGVGEVWSLSTSQNQPDYVAVGLFHDCHMLTRTPYSDNWDPDWSYLEQYGDGTLVIIDQNDPDVVYHVNQPGQWERNDHATTSNQSTTDWNTFNQYFTKGALNRRRTEILYNTVKVRPSGQFSYTELEIERSFNKGEIREVSSNFKDDLEVNHPTVNNDEKFHWVRSSTANPDHLYVGLQNWDWQQRIYRNTRINHPTVQTVINGWEEVPHPRRAPLGSPNEDREPELRDIAFDPDDASTVYIAYATSRFWSYGDFIAPFANRMVYRLNVSDLSAFPSNKFECDGTYPCSDLTMNLPNTTAQVACLAFEQGSDGGLYISTEVGVYFTNNKRIAAFDPNSPEDADDWGNSSGWVRVGGGLPHVSTSGLEINYQINRIRIGTVGRGVWEHDLHCPPELDIVLSGTNTGDSFVEARASISSNATVSTGQRVNYRGGTEVHLSAGFHAAEGAQFHAFIHPCDTEGNSFRPKSLAPSIDLVAQAPDLSFNDTGLLLYPNPATTTLTIRTTSSDSSLALPGVLTIVDVTGRTVIQENFSGTMEVIDVTSLNGLFTVLLDAGQTRLTGRVIIQ